MSISDTQQKKESVVQAALSLAAERVWGSLTLQDIAQGCGLSLEQLHDIFEDKSDIMVCFERMVDRRVLANIGDYDPGEPVRDRLFDILMERYEILNEYRPGFCSVLKSFQCDPKQAVIALPYLCRSMTWMLEAVGAQTSGFSGAIRVSGLSAIYLNVLRAWKGDESADLAKTMAALDKNLQRADRIVGWLGERV